MEVACLRVPNFLVALARREFPQLAGRPVIVASAREDGAQVRACSASLAKRGVAPGMALRRALSLCRDAAVATISERDAAREAEALRELVERTSPLVEEVAPGHLHFDVRGLARLAGETEKEFLRDLQEAARSRSGLPVALGAGKNVFVAHAASAAAWLRRGSSGDLLPLLVPAEESESFLAPLPVEVLPVSRTMKVRLRLFGLRTLADVAALPRAALEAQFGREGGRAWELAHGEDDSRIIPRREELSVSVAMELPAPASTVEPLLVATRALIRRALEERALRGAAWRQARWEAALENGETVGRTLTFREPTADGERMLFVLRQKLERLSLPASVVGLELTLSGLCTEYGHQQGFWPTGPRRWRELLEAVEQLHARLGEPHVFRIVEVEPWSRIPERQLALVPFGR